MERILDVAQFIFDEYLKITETKIDEMKLQKYYILHKENVCYYWRTII